jgi:predicted RNA-binding Zn-ribbon protein involved in translation (DUF1610 family)
MKSLLDHLECTACGRRFSADELHTVCPVCGKVLAGNSSAASEGRLASYATLRATSTYPEGGELLQQARNGGRRLFKHVRYYWLLLAEGI